MKSARPRPTRAMALAAVAVVVIGIEAQPGAAQTSQTPGTYRRDPLADLASRPGRLDADVKLVKLDSCDPGVLSKPQLAPVNHEEAAKRSRAKAEMDGYHAAIDAYAAGNADGAFERMGAFDQERLARTLMAINKRGIDLQTPWDGRRYLLAVMLHSDAALRLAGDTYGQNMYDQFQAAADLLQLGVRCAPDRVRPFVSRWYVGLSRYLRDRAVLRAAGDLLELGRKRLGDNPPLLLESGVLAESVATLYALSWTDTRQSWGSGEGAVVRRVVESRRAWLGDAGRWLSRAAALDPGNDLALLHLGRVRALQFDDAEALKALGAVVERTRSDEAAYLAALFSGAVHDRQDRLDEAAASYGLALDRIPGGHAARVGLAEVRRRAGRADEARDGLRTLVTAMSDAVREPLWWYILEPPGTADARLDGLRAEARR